MKGIIRQGYRKSSWKQSSAQCYFVLYKWNDQLLKILLIAIKLKQKRTKTCDTVAKDTKLCSNFTGAYTMRLVQKKEKS